ncbi:hypothetical protein EJB00_05925 [Wolbachia endosymbiont of Drosophila mauritiana]|uniref:hypothetical protein n=1 Tax=unclassified Wolbachia TaxID=2640676 RepID=UPI00107EC820|nr:MULTISPECIES: hypothetical protein [unclassified Wolbachia]QCB63053.1 hypothetical protein EJA99_05940 [Wolbachia endosymbiont of Drosophila mauritiana]QCB64099.1 hypothetical protein EJB00_05925 [Wolbachia endosymbiont of Drosophila mauritiana]TGB05940.1 hypothetical protein E5C28_05525 [Wolbachia endosymbiont of Drosophila mauritiana]
MEPTNSTFFDIDYPELKKAISDIIESIVQFSQEEKRKLFEALSEQVKGMNLKDLGLAINDQGLQKEVNKELFIRFIEEGLKGLTPESVNSKIIEGALKSVNQQAIGNVINNNKGPLDNLVNYFKSASANEKIGMASAVMVLGAAFSPLIVLATLIALVAIGGRYVGIGIGKAGEKIKEGAIEAGKAVKSSYKDLIDKLPTIQARENNFDRLRSELLAGIADDSKLKAGQSMEEAKNQNKIVEMLRNEGQQSAIQELVKNGTIENFSEADMIRLLEKGLSTHLDDKKPFDDLIDQFQPAIMAIGEGKIEKVEEKVNEKAQKMKPSPEVKNPNLEQVSEEGKEVG